MVKYVVVLEREPACAEELVDSLNGEGYEVHLKVDEMGCLRSIEERLPDLLVLSIGPAAAGGLTILRVLREHPRGNRLPVILLSSSREYLDARDGFCSGADMILTKPVRPESVVAAARWLLGPRPVFEPCSAAQPS